MSVTTVPTQGQVSVKGRRKSNSTSTHVSTGESSSGSGTGRKGKSKAKENWDDDFVFHRPPPKPPPRATREPSPVPSFADSAIWGDDSDEDNDDTIKLSIPLSPPSTSLPSTVTPPSETVGLISQQEAKASIEEPARRLVKKHKQTQSSVRLQDDLPIDPGFQPRSSSSSAALAAALRPKEAAATIDKQTVNEAAKSKGVGRKLLGKMSKRFSGTITPIETSTSDSPLRRPRSSTNVNTIKQPPSRSSSIRRSSSSILRVIHPSASTSSLVTPVPPVPSYPSPPLTAHPSRGFHLPSPSPNSPYHSSSSLHGSGLLPSRSASGSSHRSEPIPPLPTSTSFPILNHRFEGTEEDDPERTPRKKARPQSVQVTKKPSMREAGLGLGLASEPSWRPNWKGPTSEASRKKSETSITFDTPTTPTQSSKPQTALRRLGSLSKKHGRKLSGGWKFGSSTTLAEPPLPTVFASPAQTVRGASAPSSRIVHGSSTVRKVNAEEVDRAIESWATPDDDLPLTIKKAERRRNSWNDLSIPRSVLEKQKELKAGMSAVRRFAKGIESLKRLREEYELLGLADRAEAEYAHWWEVADVLIEIGSTSAVNEENGKTAAQPSRERRVTLASSAKPIRPSTPRSSSDTVYHDAVSEGEDGSGPPRASPLPDQWRASTGRQDLSKRQLQVLRNMLSCPSTTSLTALPLDPVGRLSPVQSTPVASPAGARSITLPAPSIPSASAVSRPGGRGGGGGGGGQKKRRALFEFIRSLRQAARADEISSSPSAATEIERSPPVSYMMTSSRSSFSGLARAGTDGKGRRPSVRGMFRSTAVTAAAATATQYPQRLRPLDSDATLRASTRTLPSSATESSVSELSTARSHSESESGTVDSRVEAPLVIALTPENLGPLLEALEACEVRLQECLWLAKQ